MDDRIRLFEPGEIIITPKAQQVIDGFKHCGNFSVEPYIDAHCSGDWGELGEPLDSVYLVGQTDMSHDVFIGVSTVWEPRQTTVYLPSVAWPIEVGPAHIEPGIGDTLYVYRG